MQPELRGIAIYFIYLFMYLLTYLFNHKSKDECNELEQKTLEREKGREGEQWVWQHWEGYSISHLPVTVQMKIPPSAVHLRNEVKGGK